MRLRPIRWRKDGFGVRFVALPVLRGSVVYSESTRLAAYSLRCAHWQVWMDDGVTRRVVDRALTYKTALRRIRELKEAGWPLCEERGR